MKSFTPMNWISSFVLSKFLTPYFKNLNEKHVNVGIWNGIAISSFLRINIA